MAQQVFKTLGLVLTSVIATAFISCSNDLFMEFDFDEFNQLDDFSTLNTVTRNEHLSLIDSIKKENHEYYMELMSDGIAKIGVYYSEKEGYCYRCKSGKEAGISEEWYEYIKKTI